MTINFPARDSPALGLVHPTKAELIAQSRLNSVEWSGALSTDAYLRREEHLAKQSLTEASGISYWILVDLSLPADDRPVYAGCETYRKRALVASGGCVREGIAHGVGSVFTPPIFRGRGYAVRMMRELAIQLRTYQAPEQACLFSVLFSDIGKTFYSRLGWTAFPSAHVQLRPSVVQETLYPASGMAEPAVDFLRAEDLHDLCTRDEAMLRQTLARGSSACTAVSLCPDQQTMAWHHAREEFVANELFGRTPAVKGAITRIDRHTRAWCLWTRTYYNRDPTQRNGNHFHVLRLVIEGAGKAEPSAEAVAAVRRLLQAAQAQANEWMSQGVELWNPHPITFSAAKQIDPSVQLIHRVEESIASLSWLGKPADQEVIWYSNEKYGWC